jgi:hypothetical protein
MKLKMQHVGPSRDKTRSHYSVAAPSFFGDHAKDEARADHQTLKSNLDFIEEKAREHLKDWFLGIEMSTKAPELTLTVCTGAYRHAPDFSGFKTWISSHDF